MLEFVLFVRPISAGTSSMQNMSWLLGIHRSIVWQIAEDYSHCEFLIRLPGYCPMPAFRDVNDVSLVVRRLHKSRKEVRRELGVADDVKLVILNFGGQPSGWHLKEEFLPSGWLGLVCSASDSEDLPPNSKKLAKDAYTPDIIAASDCMLGKIGYGTASEALAFKCPFVFVRRDYFNEEPFVRNMLEQNTAYELHALSTQWKELCQKNIDIQAACASIESHMKGLKREAAERGWNLNAVTEYGTYTAFRIVENVRMFIPSQNVTQRCLSLIS